MIMHDAGTAAGTLTYPRAESRSEWRVDALVHVLGVVLGLAACVGLAVLALRGGDPTVMASLAVYGVGLLGMLGCSATYNIGGAAGRGALWRRLDHAAIFVMIAGTYTPFAAVALDGAWGFGLLAFVWTGAAAGVLVKLVHPGRLETLSIPAYLLLGWIILVALEPLIAAVSTPTLGLLVAGGILYSVGVLFHRWHRLPYNRAVWHGFVLVAAACHYLAVLDVVTGWSGPTGRP